MKKRKFADGGIYTAEMGQPPMEPDGGSVSPKPVMKKPMPKPVPKKPMMKPKGRPMYPAMYSDSVPVDEPVSPSIAPRTGVPGMKHGGSASKRADGIAQRGKTRA